MLARVVRFVMVIGGLLVAGVFLVTPDGTGLLQPIDGAFAPTHVVSPAWRLIIVFGSLARALAWRSSARWSWRWVIGAGRHVCCSLRRSPVSPAGWWRSSCNGLLLALAA